MARLGAELGPEPAADLVPSSATVVAWVVVEAADDDDDLDAIPDAGITSAVVALHRLLGRTMRPWCGPALDDALRGFDPTWAPAHAVRLAAALAAGLSARHLPAGMPWSVHVEDPVGAAGPALGPVLDLLAGLLDGWDPTLAPPAVSTNLGSFTRAGAGYRPTPGRLATVPDLWIRLDPSSRAGEPLPRGGDAPVVVVRPAPEGAGDPGMPPSTGMPPRPAPALAAVARWCFPAVDAGVGGAAGLFDGTGFPTPALRSDQQEGGCAAGGRCLGRSGGAGGGGPEQTGGAGSDGPEGAGGSAGPDHDRGLPEGGPVAGARSWPGPWRREEADLRLIARPDEAGPWCWRALVEAEHPAGSRARHARLVQAAAAREGSTDELRRHARALRATGRAAWALDVWAVADAALSDRLVADVVQVPEGCTPGELALALAARAEEAALRARALVSGQTAG